MMRPSGEASGKGRLWAARRAAADERQQTQWHCQRQHFGSSLHPPLLVLLFARLRGFEQRDQRRRDTSAVAAQHNHAATSQRTASRWSIAQRCAASQQSAAPLFCMSTAVCCTVLRCATAATTTFHCTALHCTVHAPPLLAQRTDGASPSLFPAPSSLCHQPHDTQLPQLSWPHAGEEHGVVRKWLHGGVSRLGAKRPKKKNSEKRRARRCDAPVHCAIRPAECGVSAVRCSAVRCDRLRCWGESASRCCSLRRIGAVHPPPSDPLSSRRLVAHCSQTRVDCSTSASALPPTAI
jgi:hypothetical protein